MYRYVLLYVIIVAVLSWESYSLSSNTLEEPESDKNNRSGKFLFDAFFNLEFPDVASVDDDDDSGSRLKNCSCECGKVNQQDATPVVGGGCEGEECGVANQENRIVGGVPSEPNKYPWVARLVYDGQFHCGASLLTPNYVLTAAHCVRRLKRSKIRVILGDHDQYVASESKAIMRAVSAIIRHRNFDAESYNHDIALLRLRKPVEFSKIIKPVCLPKVGFDPAGRQGTVVGWGRTAEGGSLPAIIQEVNVPILTLGQCRAMKYRATRITSNMICAGKGKTDSCQGDSGGPLLLQNGDRYEIVGIVSWGVGCGRPGYPGVYTRVPRYMSWLEGNLRDTCLCSN